MKTIGVIGGSGFYQFPGLRDMSVDNVDTAYGSVESVCQGFLSSTSYGAPNSAPVDVEKLQADDIRIVFLPRHGANHHTPPHKVNYRANIEALHQLGADKIFAFGATGGISEKCKPGSIVVPDQIIDYTHGRAQTFFDGFSTSLEHIDFTFPFDESLRELLIKNLQGSDFNVVTTGTCACTQGPRLETKAEIEKLKKDGCDIVGMTLMPEAALARERGMAYVSLSLVVNWAAGVSDEAISLNNIMALLESSVPKIREVMLKTIMFV